ncbi:hypothetical protein [Methanoplanus limicola]|uniref:Uncharacterized protein n=1 Tax=Methanoplanus limicola DSM 2279 TaxID=937775 RepID=H1YYM6_9EURY|nr:hypothetical protein [Methanoplanus limicola]EHQ36009.1 hypothetical protein Metlim_1911 [Methanoplanus limicola DSM 2279]
MQNYGIKSRYNRRFVKASRAYRQHSSVNIVSPVKASVNPDNKKTINAIPESEINVPKAEDKSRKTQRQDDFKMLMKRHKGTLVLLAE